MGRDRSLLGGLTGVWLSSTLYMVIVDARLGGLVPGLVGLVCGLAVLALAYSAWRGRGGWLAVAAGALAGLPVGVMAWPLGVVLGLVLLGLALAGIVLGGPWLIVLGGAAIGGFPGLGVLAGGGEVSLALVPLLYHFVSVGSATVRVTGEGWPALAAGAAGAVLLVLVSRLSAAGGVVLLVDYASRLLSVPRRGPLGGVSVRLYGVLETVRIVGVLVLLGLLLPAGASA